MRFTCGHIREHNKHAGAKVGHCESTLLDFTECAARGVNEDVVFEHLHLCGTLGLMSPLMMPPMTHDRSGRGRWGVNNKDAMDHGGLLPTVCSS